MCVNLISSHHQPMRDHNGETKQRRRVCGRRGGMREGEEEADARRSKQKPRNFLGPDLRGPLLRQRSVRLAHLSALKSGTLD
jgi:hypothetical protein